MLRHLGVEMTNHCNLQCDNCPNAYSTPQKGFIAQETLELAIQYAQPGQIFQLHGHGESLLHPKMLEYTRIVCESDKAFYTSLSTNGLLLTQVMLNELLGVGLQELFISLHVPASVDAFVRAVRTVRDYPRPIRLVATSFIGNKVVADYLDYLGVLNEVNAYMEPPTEYFTWSGAVKGTRIEFPPNVVRGRIERCWFIVNNICAIVLWDGSVIACCYDFNRVNYLGHISDFPNLKHTPETYGLCKYCEPKMANGFI
jgi:hypothetical protein